MHTWTVTCEPVGAEESGTTATEDDAVIAGAAALRRLIRTTHRPGHDCPVVCLHIDTEFRIGVAAAPDDTTEALDRIDTYENAAALAAAVDDCAPDRNAHS